MKYVFYLLWQLEFLKKKYFKVFKDWKKHILDFWFKLILTKYL